MSDTDTDTSDAPSGIAIRKSIRRTLTAADGSMAHVDLVTTVAAIVECEEYRVREQINKCARDGYLETTDDDEVTLL